MVVPVFDTMATIPPGSLVGGNAPVSAPVGWSDEVSTSLRTSLGVGALLLDDLRQEQRSIAAAEARRARAIAGFCRSRPSSNDRPEAEIGAAAAVTRAARPAGAAPPREWGGGRGGPPPAV